MLLFYSTLASHLNNGFRFVAAESIHVYKYSSSWDVFAPGTLFRIFDGNCYHIPTLYQIYIIK